MAEKSFKITILLFLTIFLFGLFSASADAATLSLVPTQNTYQIGSVVTVKLLVNADTAINAISAKIQFPKDKLEITSVSKSNSIINLWAEEPTFSNGNGVADLQGIVLNPGYVGSNGLVLTLKMKPIALGTTTLILSAASVMANDGKGTNVLTAVRNGELTIVPGTPVQTKIVAKQAPVASSTVATSTIALVVATTSSTALDQNTIVVGTTNLLLQVLIGLVIILLMIIAYGAHVLHKLHKIIDNRHKQK